MYTKHNNSELDDYIPLVIIRSGERRIFTKRLKLSNMIPTSEKVTITEI